MLTPAGFSFGVMVGSAVGPATGAAGLGIYEAWVFEGLPSWPDPWVTNPMSDSEAAAGS